MIEAVLFDIDGVLMDSKAANMAWYRAFLAGYGYTDLKDTDLERGHYYSLREAIAFLSGADQATVDSIMADARELRGYPYELVSLPEHCPPVMEALARSYRLGIVSSRIHEGIRQFFEFSRLEQRFDAVVGYEDSTEHKPHAEPLLVACRRLGVAPAAAVYVGDARSDMLSAQAAGVHFIAYGDAIPDAERRVTCFQDIQPAIDGLLL